MITHQARATSAAGTAAPNTARTRHSLIVPAALAGVLAGALLGAAPAYAAGCTLKYFYNYDGSPTWHSMQIASSTSCSVEPAITRYNGGTTIAAISNDGTKWQTYVNPDGWSSWYLNDSVSFPLPDWGAPAMTPYSGGPEIAVPFQGSLFFYWEAGGQPVQNLPSALDANPAISLSAPAMTRTSGATEIAATGTDNSLWYFWNFDGSPNWGSHQIAGPSAAYGAPAISATGSSTEIAVIAPDASLWFYWAVNGVPGWHPEEVSGPGTVWGGVAMTDSAGATEITAPGPGGSIMFYWAVDGTSSWHSEQIAGPGTMQGAPAMAATGNAMEIAVTATDGSLRYYWAYNGSTNWHGTQIAPPGTASTSPAITRANGATEITAAG
jgi:hypothetical protein